MNNHAESPHHFSLWEEGTNVNELRMYSLNSKIKSESTHTPLKSLFPSINTLMLKRLGVHNAIKWLHSDCNWSRLHCYQSLFCLAFSLRCGSIYINHKSDSFTNNNKSRRSLVDYSRGGIESLGESRFVGMNRHQSIVDSLIFSFRNDLYFHSKVVMCVLG